jgi:hypothetical protein
LTRALGVPPGAARACLCPCSWPYPTPAGEEADESVRLATREKRRKRNGRHARLAHQNFAKSEVLLACQPFDPGGAGGVAKVKNWCALATTSISAISPIDQPTFQPVREKILPAELMRSQRSRIPGSVASSTCSQPSKTRCSWTSSQIATASLRQHPRQRRKLGAAQDAAHQILRRVDQNGAGARCHRRHQRIFSQARVGRRRPTPRWHRRSPPLRCRRHSPGRNGRAHGR